jgi:uncharacterized protein (TIGR02270 family)
MALTTRTFRIDLYLEHLEEAAFLYEQCRALRKQPNFEWRKLMDFEDRLEAHIDALIVGGALALEICSRRSIEGEAGELFAAVCVFCRTQQAQEFARCLQELDKTEAPRRQALIDAMSRELPPAWSDRVGDALTQSHPALLHAISAVAGYRRLPISAQIVAAPPTEDVFATAAAARALGRLRDAAALPCLSALARRAEPAISHEVLVAMLALASNEALQAAYTLAGSDEWARIPLAISGGPSACTALTNATERPESARSAALALGLLGDLRGVRPLVLLLDDKELAAHAAWSLYLITGAALFGMQFVPDPVVEDELDEHELHAWREHGQLPLRGDGRPFGTEQRLLSTDPNAWNAWLKKNASRFRPGQRYRLGEPVTPVSMLKTLLEEQLPAELRQATADELRIRYDCDLPFEAEMPVRQQLRVLRGLSRWVEQHGSLFIAGRWYFAGHPVE